MSQEYDIDDLNRRMNGAISVLSTDLNGLRTGRASASLMDPIHVEAYGSRMPLSQVATVNVPESRMITIQVWDRSMVGAVEKAIRESSLGLNPVTEGQLMRIPIPELNEERRQEMVKVGHKYAEQAKISVRHVRRDGMDSLKKMEKDGDLSQDDSRAESETIQKLTDDMISKIDTLLAKKEQEIMQI
ncbi:MAG: ribosome recycling factor [Cohaesibacteraceae bacterium]|nr:ribosome recycling factor [Cohaesibacteraceae bacterium]MBL4875595.1 ribosome recycling factor [Cohaesibacteraceae bacterium]